MGTKRKLNPLAQALVLLDTLSDEEQRTVVDYLRGKQPKAPRKKKEKADKPDKPEQAGKKTGPQGVVLPDNPDEFLKDQKAS